MCLAFLWDLAQDINGDAALVNWETPPIGQDSFAYHSKHAIQLFYSLKI